jgi:hypothetical protein
MRYLIFNVTVLAALSYLFMASPDQSFANWIGKAPQMFDAARTAGRDSMIEDDPTATAGSALLKAVEPMVEQVLSSSGDAVAAPTDPASDDARPVTTQDIESIIRGLVDARVTAGNDQDAGASADGPENSVNDDTEIVQPWPERRTGDISSTGLESGGVATDRSIPTNATPNEAADAGLGAMEIADNAPAATSAALHGMSDEEIAAAFARIQQAARPDPEPAGATQTTEMTAAGDGQADDSPAETTAVSSAPTVAESPPFMSPGQRADSLAMMVEELQLMYLERTGG